MIYLNWTANQVPLATLTASSIATGFDDANLQSQYVPETWRSVSGVLTPTIAMDFGSAITFDFLAVINHNLQSTGTVVVKAGSSASPDGSQFKTSLLARDVDRFRRLPAPQSFRYITFEFSDAGNADNFIEAGLLLIGLSARTPIQFNPEWDLGHQFVNRTQRTDGGVKLAEQVNDYWIMRCKFEGLDDEEFEALYNGIHGESHGDLYPLFIIPRERIYFGILACLNEPQIPKRFHQSAAVFEFYEETRGVEAGA